MRAVQKTIGMLADSDATVLISGETGTGKELVARAIHEHGHRGGKPFVAVNCAAIPSELLESELFGHVRGAFTGAISDREGRLSRSRGGTLFLDEIGDMDGAMQAKMLRALAGARGRAGRRQTRPGRRARHRGDPSRSRSKGARRAPFARTSFTACTSCRFICRRCATASPTSFPWPSIFCARRRRQAARAGRRGSAHPPCLARKRPRAEERDGARSRC